MRHAGLALCLFPVLVTACEQTSAGDAGVADSTVFDTAFGDTLVSGDTGSLDRWSLGPDHTVAPDTTLFDSPAPDTTLFDTTHLDTTHLDTTLPDTTHPDTTHPDTTHPDSTLPDSTLPDTTVAQDAVRGDSATAEYPHCGAGYCFRQYVQLPKYIWHLACVERNVDGVPTPTIYSGSYGDPDNVLYLTADSDYFALSIDTNGESTRVYNMNGVFYATSEGGKVFYNGQVRGDLGGHYTLAATSYNNRAVVSRSPRNDDSSVQLWDCTADTGCTHWRNYANIRPYDMLPFNGDLFLLGREPKGTSGYNEGRARVAGLNAGIVLDDSSTGIAVQGAVFDGRLYVGITNPARIKSYDGSSWRDEHSFVGFHHLGDLHAYDGKLFAAVVIDGGAAEVWSTSGDGSWSLVFSQSNLAGYGVNSGISHQGALVVLNNAAGFLSSCGDKLYLSLNTPGAPIRQGPGHILEIVAAP